VCTMDRVYLPSFMVESLAEALDGGQVTVKGAHAIMALLCQTYVASGADLDALDALARAVTDGSMVDSAIFALHHAAEGDSDAASGCR